MSPTDAVVEWFDSHCHIQDGFGDAPGDVGAGAGDGRAEGAHADPLAGVVARAAEAGVSRMVVVGTGAATSAAAVDLVRAMRHPSSPAVAEGVSLWATVGLHPHDATDGLATLDGVLAREVAADGGGAGPGGSVVVAIGECGLDYHYEHSPPAVQRDVFAAQVGLALDYDLALVIHTREAWDDTFDVLGATGVPERTIVHCFTGGPDEARRCLDLGASLSFSGVVTFKNAEDVRQAASLCPLDRLLVETDSPYLAPVPHRGSANEPARVPLVGAAIAQVKGIDRQEVAVRSTANARAAFVC